jgi:hypothetical protein
MRSLLFVLFLCFIVAHDVRATTWDEPWHDEVMRNSDSFVKVKITANEGSVAKAELMSKSERTITITGAVASPSRSAQNVLNIERCLIDDPIQARRLTF